uniref:Uncharacterized protein n=1 Tax=Sphaerodactylus townsendi TaxID=933632 RepID=A0ACB8G2Y3_9SAUR
MSGSAIPPAACLSYSARSQCLLCRGCVLCASLTVAPHLPRYGCIDSPCGAGPFRTDGLVTAPRVTGRRGHRGPGAGTPFVLLARAWAVSGSQRFHRALCSSENLGAETALVFTVGGSRCKKPGASSDTTSPDLCLETAVAVAATAAYALCEQLGVTSEGSQEAGYFQPVSLSFSVDTTVLSGWGVPTVRGLGMSRFQEQAQNTEHLVWDLSGVAGGRSPPIVALFCWPLRISPNLDDHMRAGGVGGVEREIAILKLIEHPHVLKLHDVYENKKYL